MNTQNGKYSPAFKFKVVLDALRAEGRGGEAEVARAYGIHPMTPHLEAAVPPAGARRRSSRARQGSPTWREWWVKKKWRLRSWQLDGALVVEDKVALVERRRSEAATLEELE